MAHINNGNLFNCSGIASVGNYCHSPSDHSCFPSPQPSAPAGQCMEWNPQKTARETWTRTQHRFTLRSSHSRTPHTSQDWNGVLSPPEKLYPPLGYHAINAYIACLEKTAVRQLFIHFLLYSRRGKNPAFKNGFSKFIYRKKIYCSYSRAKQASHSNPNGWVTFFFH